MSLKEVCPLISVIVPVYNVADYVVECLESLILQTYPNLEIIVIDDGSTDESGELVDVFAANHERFRVIHKINGGLAAARNDGLATMKGDWAAFVDSDDVIAPVYIEALYRAASESGCAMSAVRYGFKFMDGDKVEFEEDADKVFAYSVLGEAEYQRELLYQKSDNGSPYRLVRSEIAKADPYPVGYVYEDLARTYRWVRSAGSVAVLDTQRLYAYRLRSSSTLRCAFNENKAKSCFDITGQLYTDITDWYPELTDAVHSRCFSVHRIVFAQAPRGSEVELRVWEGIKRHRSVVLKDNQARKRERMAAAVACTGLGSFRLFCDAYPTIQHILRTQ